MLNLFQHPWMRPMQHCSKIDPETSSGGRKPGHFFRVKSTLTTFDPSSAGSATGASFSASSCSSGTSTAPLAWNFRLKSTAGSTKSVMAANGTTKVDGTPPKLNPTVNSWSSTFWGPRREGGKERGVFVWVGGLG